VSVSAFASLNSELSCENVPLRAIAEAVGTPVHVYSATDIRARYDELDSAFGSYPHHLHYAIKANSTLAIVRLLRTLGAKADANSNGEIDVALRAGYSPGEIVFTGVGKTSAELERAVALGLDAINAESPGELDRIEVIAQRLNRRARVALRINPSVDAESHPHISTGLPATKFGVSLETAREMIHSLAQLSALTLDGLHVHVGSQITRATPFKRSAETLVALAQDAAGAGIRLERLDLGGGLGIGYEPDQTVIPPAQYAAALLDAVRETGLTLVVEPGRFLVGPAGILLTQVVDLKAKPGNSHFVIVDAGMTDLARPALYGAYHRIEPVSVRPGPTITADIVGPVCETTDTLGFARVLPPLEIGDLVAIRDTGAYGAVMASNYNRRPLAAEVLVDGATWRVVRRRQTTDDMLQWDE
jgi:diaminopimelate decarboxylase